MRISRKAPAGAVVLSWLAGLMALPGEGPVLSVQPGGEPGEVLVQGSGRADGSHRVELSYGLEAWWPVFGIRETPQWTWSFDDAGSVRSGFFRLVDAVPPAIDAHSSWKTGIELPDDPFLSEPVSGTGQPFASIEIRWVKFALIMDGLPRAYFQDSSTYPFHFTFATERLFPFLGMTLDEFNAVSLHRSGQEAALGAVLWAPQRNEFGIQFVGQDEYPREMLRFLYEAVAAQLTVPDGAEGFYMPTTEQVPAAERERAYFARHGIEVSSAERWIGGSVTYAEGWALGRLVFVAAGEIEEAYASGVLLPSDILLTDGVPAEVPFVAGIVTLTPTTPNSHVAILAQSYGIPFVYLREPAEQARILGLAGREVVLRTRGFSGENIGVFDVEGIEPAYRSEILALKEPLPLAITPMQGAGAISVSSLETAVPEDIGTIGGKAANFGFLRLVVPKNSPAEARAFTFDLWKAYLDQIVDGGRSLREEIATRLAGVTWPADIAALDAILGGIRDLIEDEADFTPGQRSAILAALADLDDHRKIRFRSSTNVEDSGVFVGAGLYDSYSGCLADDTDGDDAGPSHCDPDEPNERGVFRAMRKVYASFYNRNAFIERLRHGIDEAEVGMAILVHYSFPDELEAANGVATSRPAGPNFLYTTMVSQLGAESVTNPTGGSIPEVVEIQGYRPQPGSATLVHHQRSNRLLLGIDTVMDWQDDYQDFGEMFFALTDAYRAHFPGLGAFTLEFEFKKLVDGRLVVKQVRQVPEAEGRPAPAIALVDSPTSLKIFQGERGDVFSNHRLKSLWRARTDERWIDPENPLGSIMVDTELDYAPDGAVVTRSGAPADWPEAVNDVLVEHGNVFARDRWSWPSQGGETTYQFRAMMPFGKGYEQDPLYTLGDFELWFHADYEHALPFIDQLGVPSSTRSDFVVLVRGSPEDPLPTGAIEVERRFTSGKGAAVRTAFYWPPAPTGVVAGYTAPLERWIGTTLTGLTSEPIELCGYFSQTYRPGHHNFSEEFLFEPQLEGGMPDSILSELEAQNIRMIYFHMGGGPDDVLKAVGFDGSFRDL